MLKTLITAIVCALFGAGFAILAKDKKILELQKEINSLNSYEHFSNVFSDGWEAGNRWGRMRGWSAHANGLSPFEI